MIDWYKLWEDEKTESYIYHGFFKNVDKETKKISTWMIGDLGTTGIGDTDKESIEDYLKKVQKNIERNQKIIQEVSEILLENEE